MTGVERVAIYTIGEMPTHAARQLVGGKWTSKLGKSIDLEQDLHALTGDRYGQVRLIVNRRI